MKNLIMLLMILLTVGCSSDRRERAPQQHTQHREVYAEPVHHQQVHHEPVQHVEPEIPVYNAMDGLDLTRLLRFAKESRSALKLERKLNSPFSPNNLDLNGDGHTDFIHVRGYGDGSLGYGFSLFTIPAIGERQPVANIEVYQNLNYSNKVTVTVTGNEQLYGYGQQYTASYYKSNMFLWAYLLTRPSPYVRDYSYNSYPTYYSRYSTVTRTKYRTRTVYKTKVKYTKVKSSNFKHSKLTKKSNPNYGKYAKTGIKRKLSKPTSTQKKFLARDMNKPVPKARGFGNKKKVSDVSNTKTKDKKISLTKKTSPPVKTIVKPKPQTKVKTRVYTSKTVKEKKKYKVKTKTKTNYNKPVKVKKSRSSSFGKPKKKKNI